MLSSIPGLYPLDARSSPAPVVITGNRAQLRTTALEHISAWKLLSHPFFSDHSLHVGTSIAAICICVQRYPWGFLFVEFHDLINNVCLTLREALNNLYIKIFYSHLFKISYPFRTPSSFLLPTQGECVNKFMSAPRVLC